MTIQVASVERDSDVCALRYRLTRILRLRLHTPTVCVRANMDVCGYECHGVHMYPYAYGTVYSHVYAYTTDILDTRPSLLLHLYTHVLYTYVYLHQCS